MTESTKMPDELITQISALDFEKLHGTGYKAAQLPS